MHKIFSVVFSVVFSDVFSGIFSDVFPDNSPLRGTATSFAGNLSEVSLFIRNGITYLQLLLPQIVIAITLCPYETILD